jgi:hypothetical protein
MIETAEVAFFTPSLDQRETLLELELATQTSPSFVKATPREQLSPSASATRWRRWWC